MSRNRFFFLRIEVLFRHTFNGWKPLNLTALQYKSTHWNCCGKAFRDLSIMDSLINFPPVIAVIDMIIVCSLPMKLKAHSVSLHGLVSISWFENTYAAHHQEGHWHIFNMENLSVIPPWVPCLYRSRVSCFVEIISLSKSLGSILTDSLYKIVHHTQSRKNLIFQCSWLDWFWKAWQYCMIISWALFSILEEWKIPSEHVDRRASSRN